MARLTRACPAGIVQHVIQRGHQQQLCFSCLDDFNAYADWLKEYAAKYQVSLHAWALMPNHVHLLCTPEQDNAVSLMMQSLGRCYVRYFNHKHQRNGALWDGRFRSCLVQTEPWLMKLYRYIELNPLRAGLVSDAGDYLWSSYRHNALGTPSGMTDEHALYLQLGRDPVSRRFNYRSYVNREMDEDELQSIRSAINKGMALGDNSFKAEIEQLTGRRMFAGKKGRPLGWRKNDESESNVQGM